MLCDGDLHVVLAGLKMSLHALDELFIAQERLFPEI